MRLLVLAAILALAGAQPAAADVASAAPGAFVLAAEADVAASPAEAYAALTRIGRWWNGEHSYSHDARRLSLDARAGGCFCERWAGGSVEHGRVLMAFEREGVRKLRLEAPLGPLQEMAVNAILTYTITAHGSGAHIAMIYRVSGDSGLGLDHVAGPVDGVIMEQFHRLIRYADTGAPE